MTMIPAIDVLDAPTAAATRRTVASRPPASYATPAGGLDAPLVDTAAIYRRRRAFVAIAVFFLTIVSVIGVGQAGAERDPQSEPVVAATTLVIVQPGDTLWDIAGRVAPDVDRRKAVDQLAEIAGGARLEVGQRLEIPAISG